jgi:hypothetical protein
MDFLVTWYTDTCLLLIFKPVFESAEENVSKIKLESNIGGLRKNTTTTPLHFL